MTHIRITNHRGTVKPKKTNEERAEAEPYDPERYKRQMIRAAQSARINRFKRKPVKENGLLSIRISR